MKEVQEAMMQMDADPTVAAIVLTGSEKAFAAGEAEMCCLEKFPLNHITL